MENLGKLLLRITVAGLMLPHGIHKLIHGIGGVKYMLGQVGMPQFLAYGVYVGEIVAPILIILGLYSRVSALLVAFTMFVATAAAHAHEIFSFTKYGGLVVELNALYLFAALSIALIGPGKFRMGNQRGFWKE
jgi:putative oxidoreductase